MYVYTLIISVEGREDGAGETRLEGGHVLAELRVKQYFDREGGGGNGGREGREGRI